MPIEFTLVTILKALTEVAAFSLIGQGVLYVFAGSSRDRNFVYTMLKTVTMPVFKLTRLITPGFILERHIWLLTPLVVLIFWVTFTYLKIRIVLNAAGHGAS